MNCECTIDMGVDEFWDLINKKYPIARIQHICSECQKVIRPKEKYLQEILVFEGEIFTTKTCLVCENLRGTFFCTWIYGELMESLSEYINNSKGEIPEHCMCVLIPEARDVICDMLNQYFKHEGYND